MTEDPRIETIRRAFEEAHFDERTADERGFAARFEREFKPLLKDGASFNLKVRAERLRRRRTGWLIVIVGAVAIVPLLVLLNTRRAERTSEFVIYGLALFGLAIYRWAVKKRPEEEDPNHARVIQAVLETFGCRAELGIASGAKALADSPVLPPYTDARILPDRLVGRFDGRIDFTALRVKCTRKEGKRTVTTFKGWYLRIDLPFSFAATTVIRDRAAAYRLVGGSGTSEVRLESDEFAKRFAVHADDQVEARMILAPDVMHHLIEETDRLQRQERDWFPTGRLMLGFRGNRAHVWLPSRATALSDWQPLDPGRLIEDLHESFAELAEIRGFLRDIDVIAESEGFRAQAARNTASSGTP